MKISETGQADNDVVLAKVEKKIKKEYTQANKDMEKKLKNYLKKFEEQDKVNKKKVKAGTMSESDYLKWRQNKIVVGKRWEQMCQVLAEDLDNSRKIAQSIVSGELPTVYANGVNYGTWEIESTGLNTNFTLYNHDAVEILVSENPALYPDPTVGSQTWQDLKSKKVQKWSKAKINSSITQGILQGEAINVVAKRLRKVTDMDYKASIRNARTMVGAAQNAGHQRSYERAEKMGVQVVKVWVATTDMRTRHSHVILDGESVAIKEKFSNGLLYPKDPSGAPSEVYNCRCREIAQVKGWEKTKGSLMVGPQESLNGMTYDEWKQWHSDAMNHKATKAFKGEIAKVKKTMPKSSVKEFEDMYRAKDAKLLEQSKLSKKSATKTTKKSSHEKYMEEMEEKLAKAKGETAKAKQEYMDALLKSGKAKNADEALVMAEKVEAKSRSSAKKTIKKETAEKANVYDKYKEKSFFDLYEDFLDKNEELADEFYSLAKKGAKEIGGTKSYYWKELTSGNLKNENIEDVLSKLDGKAKQKVGVYEKYKGKQLGDVFTEIADIDSSLAQDFQMAMMSEVQKAGKVGSEVWDDIVAGKIKNAKLDEILEKVEKNAPKKISNAPIKATKKNIAEFDAEAWKESLKANEIREFEKQTDELMKVWNYSEKDALNTYTSASYERINDALRAADEYASEQTKDDIKHITKALSKSKTEEDIILRRGSGYRSLKGLFDDDFSDELQRASLGDIDGLSQKFSGTIGQDKAFMSTTPSGAGGFDSDINYIIRAPKGTEGAYIAPLSEFEYEKEFLLQRGTKFQVKEIKVGTGSADYDIYIDIIGQEY